TGRSGGAATDRRAATEPIARGTCFGISIACSTCSSYHQSTYHQHHFSHLTKMKTTITPPVLQQRTHWGRAEDCCSDNQNSLGIVYRLASCLLLRAKKFILPPLNPTILPALFSTSPSQTSSSPSLD